MDFGSEIVVGHLHPARLGALAALRGMAPAPPPQCRVLELGVGWSSLALAAGLPGARVVAVGSAASVAEAEEIRQALALTNLELREGDPSALDDGLGTFDYVLAERVFSWIPPEQRAPLLRGVRAHLAPQGLVAMRYNTLPGWHPELALRTMALHHTRNIEDPAAKAQAARELFAYVAAAAPGEGAARKLFLTSRAEVLTRASVGDLMLDYVGPWNAPIAFADFMALAGEAGLQYVAGAHAEGCFGGDLPEALVGELEALTGGDPLAVEQYADFVTGRALRRSVLCHADVTLAARPRLARERPWHVFAPVRPGALDEASGQRSWWVAGERELQGVSPTLDAVLRTLYGAWPAAVTAEELLQATAPAAGLDDRDPATWDAFATSLLDLYRQGIVELVTHPFPIGRVSDTPATPPLVRAQIARGSGWLATAHHIPVSLGPAARALAALADGTRDADALLGEVEAAAARGELPLPPGATPEQLREMLPSALLQGLENLEFLGLLAAEAPPQR